MSINGNCHSKKMYVRGNMHHDSSLKGIGSFINNLNSHPTILLRQSFCALTKEVSRLVYSCCKTPNYNQILYVCRCPVRSQDQLEDKRQY